MKMRKTIALLSALVLAFGMASCTGGDNQSTAGTDTTTGSGAVTEATASTTKVELEGYSVSLPSDWVSIPSSDKKSVKLYKSDDANKIFGVNEIDITYKEKAKYTLVTSAFDSFEEVKDLKLGSYTWNGAKGPYGGGKELMSLNTTVGEGYISADIWTKVGDNTISVDDADVKAIIESIAISGANAETTLTSTAPAAVSTNAAAQVPDNMDAVCVQNPLAGLSAAVYIPKVDSAYLKDFLNRETDNFQASHNWTITRTDGSGQLYALNCDLIPVDKDKKTYAEKHNTPVSKDYGNGLTIFTDTMTGSTGDASCTAIFFNEKYLDGYAQLRIRLTGTKNVDTEETLLAFMEKILPYVRLEVNDAIAKTADGYLRMLLHEQDVSMPSKIKIAGTDCDITQRIGACCLLLESKFQTQDMKYKIGLDGLLTAGAFDKKDEPEITVAGLPAKLAVKQDSLGALSSTMYVKLNEKDALALYCQSTGFIDGELLDAVLKKEKIKEMLSDAKIGATKEMLTGYFTDFVSAMKIDAVSSAVTSPAVTTSAPVTTASTTTTTTTAQVPVQTTQQQAQITTQPVNHGIALSKEELAAFAERWYGQHTNYKPECVDVLSISDDGNAVIHLYNNFDDCPQTLEQYTVNIYTGEGTDSKNGKISILQDNPMWSPEDWVYGSNNGEYARILYLGRMDKNAVMNQASIQKLIDSSAGVREYVNHYSYINEIPDRNMFSTDGGEYVYMIIPADKNAYLSIDNERLTATGGLEYSRFITRTYSSQPIILRCNRNGKKDAYVCVHTKNNEQLFSPMPSKNGVNTDVGNENIEDLAFPFD